MLVYNYKNITHSGKHSTVEIIDCVVFCIKNIDGFMSNFCKKVYDCINVESPPKVDKKQQTGTEMM